VSTSNAVAVIDLSTNASTERQWQGIRRPQGPIHVLKFGLHDGTMPIGIKTMMRQRAVARAGCSRNQARAFTGSATILQLCNDGSPVNAG
jgi:hypothetical protein